MRTPTMLLALLGFGSAAGVAAADSTIPNPQIDMPAYLKVAREAAAHRETHRVTEAEFLKMAAEPNTIVLDARSREKYDLLHIRGAVNLSFPDIAIDSLAKLLPDKGVRILIYCNNNFRNEPEAFPSKAPSASLNVSTYISLFSYGYKNVYELGPLLDVKHTRLPLEPTRR
jgi:hypothetical protein